MNRKNYQKELDRVIDELRDENKTPSLLLHACCAPCSSYCLEYLSRYFKITVFYFNPNISEKEEYLHRLSEEKRLIGEMSFANPVSIIEGEYKPEDFFAAAKGLENEPEGGARCKKCFELRLERSAEAAKSIGADYFTTTLSISPLKDAQFLNETGEKCAEKHGVNWLYSDFKKREGYKRSIILSQKYSLYRQNYCGCVYSKRDAEIRERAAKNFE